MELGAYPQHTLRNFQYPSLNKERFAYSKPFSVLTKRIVNIFIAGGTFLPSRSFSQLASKRIFADLYTEKRLEQQAGNSMRKIHKTTDTKQTKRKWK